jgi:uncharacterized protein
LRLGIASRYRERVIDEVTIDEAARRLSGASPPGTRVILFGSHARGEAGKHSDLDFLVIEPEVANAAEESVRLRRTLRGLLFAADVIVRASRGFASGAMSEEPDPRGARRGPRAGCMMASGRGLTPLRAALRGHR